MLNHTKEKKPTQYKRQKVQTKNVPIKFLSYSPSCFIKAHINFKRKTTQSSIWIFMRLFIRNEIQCSNIKVQWKNTNQEQSKYEPLQYKR